MTARDPVERGRRAAPVLLEQPGASPARSPPGSPSRPPSPARAPHVGLPLPPDDDERPDQPLVGDDQHEAGPGGGGGHHLHGSTASLRASLAMTTARQRSPRIEQGSGWDRGCGTCSDQSRDLRRDVDPRTARARRCRHWRATPAVSAAVRVTCRKHSRGPSWIVEDQARLTLSSRSPSRPASGRSADRSRRLHRQAYLGRHALDRQDLRGIGTAPIATTPGRFRRPLPRGRG